MYKVTPAEPPAPAVDAATGDVASATAAALAAAADSGGGGPVDESNIIAWMGQVERALAKAIHEYRRATATETREKLESITVKQRGRRRLSVASLLSRASTDSQVDNRWGHCCTCLLI